MKRLFILTIFLSLLAPRTAWGALNFSEEIKNIYNTYSKYLDKQWVALGWEYEVPSRHYQETERISIDDIRMQATLASAYRFRADYQSKYKIKTAIMNVLGPEVPLVTNIPDQNNNGQRLSTRGFGDMIGLYLALKVATTRNDVFTEKEQAQILNRIKEVYPWALAGYDNENRALLSSAYGLAILRNPRANFSTADQKKYTQQIRDKIKIGLKSIDDFGVYHEGASQSYSLHYQLVSSLMLSYLAQNLPDKNYAALTKKMLTRTHDWYKLGNLNWKGSGRPTGIGLQTVLLRTLGEKYLGTKNWADYWQTEKKGRGFILASAPERLVWKDDVDNTFNDDYSFLNMAELFWDNFSPPVSLSVKPPK